MNEKNSSKALYSQVMWLVSDYTELNENEIITSNREECVDARYILVGVLSSYLTDDEIARISGLTRACANKIRNGMKARMGRFSFRCLHESVRMIIKEWVENHLNKLAMH